MVLLVPKETLDRLDRLALMAILALPAQQEPLRPWPALLGQLDRQARRVPLAQIRQFLALRAPRDLRVNLDLQVPRALLDRLVRLALLLRLPARLAQLALPVRVAEVVRLAPPAQLARRARLDPLV